MNLAISPQRDLYIQLALICDFKLIYEKTCLFIPYNFFN